MKHRLFALASLLVIFALVLPAWTPTSQAREAASPLGSRVAHPPIQIFMPMVLKDHDIVQPVIPDTTVPLSDESTSQMTVSPDGATLTFAGETSELLQVDAGDVIVADTSTAAPDGVLRKVTSISDANGEVIVQTEEASLEDAIQDGEIDATQSLFPENITSNELQEGVTMIAPQAASALSFAYTVNKVLYHSDYGDVVATGDISFETGFDFSLKLKDFSLKRLTFTNTTSETTSLTITASTEYAGGVEVEIAKHRFKPITFWIGCVPVVIIPELTVYVGMDGSVYAGITTSVSQSASLTAGLQYQSGSWSPIWDLNNSFTFTKPTPTIQMSVKAYAGIGLAFKLYGVAGPYVKVQGYLELEVTLENPPWALYAGLEVPAGVEMEIASETIMSYEFTIFDHRWRLMPPAEPSGPIPADGATNQPSDLTLRWAAASDEITPTYDVYLEAGDTTPDVRVSADQAGRSFNPGWLAPATQYYWQIRANGLFGTSTAGPVWTFTTGTTAMVYVEAGEFQMGCDPLHNASLPCDSSWERPLHTVYLDSYYIGNTEVTNGEYAECVTAGPCTPPVSNSSRTRASYYNDPAYASYPVIHVDWPQAQAYCEWKGGGLPTEAQWEKAARGSTPQAFPWGDGAANCTLANFDNCIGDTSPIGSYASGTSPFLALDMAGNVWEWVSDWYSETYYSESSYANPTGPESGLQKGMRGGAFYASDPAIGPSYEFLRTAHRAWSWGEADYLGFRCAVSHNYQLEYVSGSGQTYSGGGMLFPMVFRIKDILTGTYLTQLSELGLSLTATASLGYQDLDFNNANNYGNLGSEGWGGYYWVPANGGPAYTLEITVTLSLNGNVVDTYLITENITGGF